MEMKKTQTLFGVLLLAFALWGLGPMVSEQLLVFEGESVVNASAELEFEQLPPPEEAMQKPPVDEYGEPIPHAIPIPEGEIPLLFDEEILPGEDATVDQVEPTPYIEI